MIRLIVASTPDGRREEVIFTVDMVADAESFFFFGGDSDMTVNTDTTVDDLPASFPLDYILKRE
ncbi:MAG: hypothetical protein PHS93_07790 [Candidatus Omnitrophica bacterium]|nr:hypothetical protein [Candidatus Omnitrophota bacterium]